MTSPASFFIAVSVFVFQPLRAATVDTVNIYSNAMQKDIKCVVIRPDYCRE